MHKPHNLTIMAFTKEDFINYIRHFNRKEYDLQHGFYGPNVSLKLPAIPALEGSAAISNHYDFIHHLADETLDVLSVMFDDYEKPTKIL